MAVDAHAKQSLREIGQALDHGQFPGVKSGGVVVPIDLERSPLVMGMEKRSDRSKRTRRQTSRGRASRTTGGSAAPSATAPFIGANLRAKYARDVEDVAQAYPGARVWWRPDGIWLLTTSAIIDGAGCRASFVTAAPFDCTVRVRSWGFWYPTIWIGPRHTNFPDGSVCSFEPDDGTWMPGDPLVDLLDINTLWALRHLHLRTFGRWPGRQSVRDPYERTIEIQSDELCGCDAATKIYGECCRRADLARNRIADAVHFNCTRAWGERRPPEFVVDFMLGRSELPSIPCD